MGRNESRRPTISARDLVKVFRTPTRFPGRFGSLRTLFTRTYTERRAVDGVSFSIDQGELVGYLGPNGAGKSTTVKMLTGILEPTRGSAEVAGIVPWQRRQQNSLNIGVVFGQRSQLWWDLPLIESFELVGQMYGVEPARYRVNLDRFRELLALDDFIGTPVRQLSLGQRMRGELTAALLHDPPVVYLDEPTVGLDIVAKERIRTFVADMNRERGTTVILTTHDLADVERLCSRVILIDRGRVLFDGSVARLKATYAPHRELVVHLDPDGDVPDTKAQIAMAGVEHVTDAGGRLRFRFDPAVVRAPDLIGEVASRYPIADLSIVEPELEAIVRRLYARPDEAQA
ncbi:MAG TPA: ATP-binding cassette domain-containing protein [Candidatus Limnocylindria bacterium]